MSSNWFDLAGRVALVTGAGANGGIGHAIAKAMARFGADLLICDVDVEGAEQTAREVRTLDRRCVAVRCDVGSAEEVLAMFAALDRAFNYIDILVNNVGIGCRSRPEDLSLDDWRRVVAVNLDGTFLCCREAGRRMIRRGQGGSIVNVSSIAGGSALGRGNFVYSVTKGGINQLTRELAVEWSPYQIRVNAIQPAQTLTPAVQRMFDDPRLNTDKLRERLLAGIPLGRFGEPEDIAKAAVFLTSDAAGFITGHLLPVDGGNLALNAGGSRLWPGDE
ncbi:MAG: SDR family oxidoreductase [Chloroflexi bacterium]|nr:SDR family oxidoreductase [Chloroflexota bacterium]